MVLVSLQHSVVLIQRLSTTTLRQMWITADVSLFNQVALTQHSQTTTHTLTPTMVLV
jgi:hypothetical protein